MTDKIQHIIQEIRDKKAKLTNELSNSASKIDQLSSEIEALKSTLQINEVKVQSLQNEVASLSGQLELEKNKAVEVSSIVEVNKDEQIDELVKEIEYCITQLKNKA